MTDDELEKYLREALRPTSDGPARRDLWAALMKRLEERPRWSLIDVGLGIAVAVVLLISPDRLWLIAYHL
jgi:hypothetical protein